MSADSIAQTILEQGRIKAQGIQNQAAIWGNLASTLGQLPGQIFGQIQQQKEQQQQEQARQQATQLRQQQIEENKAQAAAQQRGVAGEDAVNRILSSVGERDEATGAIVFSPVKLQQAFAQANVPLQIQEKYLQANDNISKVMSSFGQQKIDHRADAAHAILDAYPKDQPIDPQTANLGLDLAVANGLASEQDIAPIRKALTQTNDARPALRTITQFSQKYKDLNKPVMMAEGAQVRDPETWALLAENPPKPQTITDATLKAQFQHLAQQRRLGTLSPEEEANYQAYLELEQANRAPVKPATVGSFEDYVTRTYGEKPTSAQILAARKAYGQADDRPVSINMSGMNALYAATDPKAIAAGIRTGQMPPDISQYGRPVQGAIASELAKPGPNGEPGFNLARAQREWKAQLNLNRTMNGSQQVRLDESIRSGLAMYDRIDDLADKWKGKGWGPLSRANLAVARQGGLGPEAAALANQLTGQIGQLTSDVATIEQGGLTPTNEARAVAEKSMQDWWGTGTIKAMTAQGRANMQIRHLARNTQEPMVPGNGVDTSPAQPATPGAPSGVAPTKGQVKTFPNGRKGVWDGQGWVAQ